LLPIHPFSTYFNTLLLLAYVTLNLRYVASNCSSVVESNIEHIALYKSPLSASGNLGNKCFTHAFFAWNQHRSK
jgi:hypothetical protein